jgi:hypothetical protein
MKCSSLVVVVAAVVLVVRLRLIVLWLSRRLWLAVGVDMG